MTRMGPTATKAARPTAATMSLQGCRSRVSRIRAEASMPVERPVRPALAWVRDGLEMERRPKTASPGGQWCGWLFGRSFQATAAASLGGPSSGCSISGAHWSGFSDVVSAAAASLACLELLLHLEPQSGGRHLEPLSGGCISRAFMHSLRFRTSFQRRLHFGRSLARLPFRTFVQRWAASRARPSSGCRISGRRSSGCNSRTFVRSLRFRALVQRAPVQRP